LWKGDKSEREEELKGKTRVKSGGEEIGVLKEKSLKGEESHGVEV